MADRKILPEQVLPHLRAALETGSNDICFWAAQIATGFPSPELVVPLENLLFHNPDADVRFFAAGAIRHISDERALSALQQALLHEQDPEVREILPQSIEEWHEWKKIREEENKLASKAE